MGSTGCKESGGHIDLAERVAIANAHQLVRQASQRGVVRPRRARQQIHREAPLRSTRNNGFQKRAFRFHPAPRGGKRSRLKNILRLDALAFSKRRSAARAVRIATSASERFIRLIGS